MPIKIDENKIMEGWVNKPKGSLQILFERRWINPNQIKRYTKDGHKDPIGASQNQSNADHPSVPVNPTGCNYSITELMQR